MEYASLLNQAGLLIGGSLGVYGLTEAAKRLNFITWVSEGQTGRLRAVAACLSALAVFLEHWSTKGLAPKDLQDVLMSILALAGTWALAHGTHVVVSKAVDNDQPPV